MQWVSVMIDLLRKQSLIPKFSPFDPKAAAICLCSVWGPKSSYMFDTLGNILLDLCSLAVLFLGGLVICFLISEYELSNLKLRRWSYLFCKYSSPSYPRVFKRNVVLLFFGFKLDNWICVEQYFLNIQNHGYFGAVLPWITD